MAERRSKAAPRHAGPSARPQPASKHADGSGLGRRLGCRWSLGGGWLLSGSRGRCRARGARRFARGVRLACWRRFTALLRARRGHLFALFDASDDLIAGEIAVGLSSLAARVALLDPERLSAAALTEQWSCDEPEPTA